MPSRWIEDGHPSRPIWLVGEAPGADEVSSGRPFTGQSGYLLNALLAEAHIDRSACFLTNVCHERPPSYTKNGKVIHNDINQFFANKSEAKREGLSEDRGRYPRAPIVEGIQHLRELIAEYHPRLIIAFGNTPLWALAGEVGITKWRGSVLSIASSTKLVCTFHPADVLRQITHRPIVVQDLRRAERESHYDGIRRPQWSFCVEPSLSDCVDWFHEYSRNSEAPLVCDTEGWGRVDCIGFASSSTNAICIPFKRETSDGLHYWSEDDEFSVTQLCRTVLSSRPQIFHNALWDCQVIARRWGLFPRLFVDTQVAQHVAFPGLLGGKIDPVTGEVDKKGSSLSLSFIASMYCEYYRYWKDDGRTFDPSLHNERQYWNYNCEDCVRTYECWESGLEPVLTTLDLRAQFDFEMRLFGPVFKMMFRGLRYDSAAVRRDRARLETDAAVARSWLNEATDCTDFNPDSTPQMRALFYDDLKLPLIKDRKTGAPSLNDSALDTHARRNPLLLPLVRQIQNYRTLDTLRSALAARVCDDGRFRCALNIGFVETFRFSSNETAFGEGSNLQNIKRPDDD